MRWSDPIWIIASDTVFPEAFKSGLSENFYTVEECQRTCNIASDF